MTAHLAPTTMLSSSHPSPIPEVPLAQLVDEVYASASPPLRSSMVAQLLGKVYQAAPVAERFSLVRHLMRPLGILSLVAIANGVFAKIRFHGSLDDVQAGLDDLQGVQVEDVITLANYAQQVSVQAVDGLAQLLTASPALASSAAAMVLVKILLAHRANNRRASDDDGLV
jgi:hypothetical protein